MAFNRYISGRCTRVMFPIADASACDQGDFMKITSDLVLKVAASTDNLSFVGIADEKKVASDGKTSVAVLVPSEDAVFEGSLDAAATGVIGAGLAWQAALTLTPTATDQIAVAVEPFSSSGPAVVRYRLLKGAATGNKFMPGGGGLGDAS